MRINCLEPKIFNKIAAGEVVERPASIVKELVENSIDAGANMITIKIENGGISKINISDNGCGIHFDDLKTAFLPHATSKIKNEADLFRIQTLGFRGEALASISAVSEVTLISKEPTAEMGGRIEISGGVVTCPPCKEGCADGTDITIQNLFFNVPARAKFLKKPKTEEAEITSLVSKLILANPMVQIKYIVDGKIKYISSGKGIKDALFVVHGKEAVENSVSIDADFGYIKIYGFVGKPSISKPNRTYQTILINNRVVENITISSAVQNAFGEMLMKKQFPLFVLYIDLDYSKVDVNVHPNKKEVRFENNSDIYVKVYETVNRSLNGLDHTVTIETPEPAFVPPQLSATAPNAQEFPYVKPFSISISTPPISTPRSGASGITVSKPTQPSKTPKEGEESGDKSVIDYNEVNGAIGTAKEEEEAGEPTAVLKAMDILSENKTRLNDGVRVGSKLLEQLTKQMEKSEQLEIPDIDKVSIKVVGILFNTYIILEQGDSFFLLDQHAGHERLLFDRLSKQLEERNIEIQRLLIPYNLSVNAEEEAFLESITPRLDEIGFIIEPFGSKTFRVLSVPYVLETINIKDFFAKILGDIKQLQTLELKNLLKDTLATMACKSAVKAGDKLSGLEINTLLTMFATEGNKLLCPHGRPVMVRVPRKEVEKWFKRIV